ncbi:MAG: hypothetical protein ABSD39_05100 [Terriglobales bacterium]
MTRSPDDAMGMRERAFLIGAPLAIIPAMSILPAVSFLIAFPRTEHGRAIGFAVVPLCALIGSFGMWKLALGAVEKPWGIFNILNVTALMVLIVIAAYTGLFLALLTLKL